MDIENLKIVEEFNYNIYFKKLNLLIIDLISNYKEMIFLQEAQETIKNLETSLNKIKKPLEETPYKNTKEFDNPIDNFQHKNYLLNPKKIIIKNLKKNNIPCNIFYTYNGDEILLTKMQNISLYEQLLLENIKITPNDENLYNIIEKSIEYIF